MAPKSMLTKLKTVQKRQVHIDDDVPDRVRVKTLPLSTPVTIIPPVTPEERAQWRIARKTQASLTWAQRIEAMKKDGRLWFSNGTWHRRGDMDQEKQWVQAKIMELYAEGKIVKSNGLWEIFFM
jgi:hypothetical protein